MEQVKVNVVSIISSTQEEVETLSQIRSAILPGSRLSHLFTDDLIVWVVSEMREGIAPDIFRRYEEMTLECVTRAQIISGAIP